MAGVGVPPSPRSAPSPSPRLDEAVEATLATLTHEPPPPPRPALLRMSCERDEEEEQEGTPSIAVSGMAGVAAAVVAFRDAFKCTRCDCDVVDCDCDCASARECMTPRERGERARMGVRALCVRCGFDWLGLLEQQAKGVQRWPRSMTIDAVCSRSESIGVR